MLPTLAQVCGLRTVWHLHTSIGRGLSSKGAVVVPLRECRLFQGIGVEVAIARKSQQSSGSPLVLRGESGRRLSPRRGRGTLVVLDVVGGALDVAVALEGGLLVACEARRRPQRIECRRSGLRAGSERRGRGRGGQCAEAQRRCRQADVEVEVEASGQRHLARGHQRCAAAAGVRRRRLRVPLTALRSILFRRGRRKRRRHRGARLGAARRGRHLVRGLGVFHLDPLAADPVAVVPGQRGGHGRGALGARQEADEAEAPGSARRRVDHDHGVGHDAEGLEVVAELAGGRVLRQATDEELVGARHRTLYVDPPPSYVVHCGQHGLRPRGIGKGDVAETPRTAIRPAKHHGVSD
mmetsp:Transcript_110686/g.352508  ORF Transcript_110686/g.352508 Transcript_110686/m.352508 type:complete len:352 (-) Transcript_110686:315-1370(-)